MSCSTVRFSLELGFEKTAAQMHVSIKTRSTIVMLIHVNVHFGLTQFGFVQLSLAVFVVIEFPGHRRQFLQVTGAQEFSCRTGYGISAIGHVGPLAQFRQLLFREINC